MKNFLLVTLIFSIFLAAETNWYSVYNSDRKIGYYIVSINPTEGGYKYKKKMFLLRGQEFVEAVSMYAKVDKQHRLLSSKETNIQQQTVKAKVNHSLETIDLTFDNGKSTIPFTDNVYADIGGKEMKVLGMLKKGARASMQTLENGKLRSLKLRTTSKGSYRYKGKKIKVYVVHATALEMQLKLYVSSSGKVYKVKMPKQGITFKKVPKQQALSASDDAGPSVGASDERSNAGSSVAGVPQDNKMLDIIGREVESTVNRGTAQFLNSFINQSAFIQKIIGLMNLSASESQLLAQQLQNIRFGDNIAGVVAQGGSYKYLGICENPPKLLFRLLTPQGTINYHKFHLIPSRDTIKSNDVYVLTTGEDLSLTMAKSMSMAMQKTGFFGWASW